MSSDRLVELESAVAHLQHDVDQLNAVILRQQEEIDELKLAISRLESRVDQAAGETEVRDLEEERPPHY